LIWQPKLQTNHCTYMLKIKQHKILTNVPKTLVSNVLGVVQTPWHSCAWASHPFILMTLLYLFPTILKPLNDLLHLLCHNDAL